MLVQTPLYFPLYKKKYVFPTSVPEKASKQWQSRSSNKYPEGTDCGLYRAIFHLKEPQLLGDMFDSRSETRDVQGKPVISYLKARKLSKTTAIMSKGHRSQLKEDPAG